MCETVYAYVHCYLYIENKNSKGLKCIYKYNMYNIALFLHENDSYIKLQCAFHLFFL